MDIDWQGYPCDGRYDELVAGPGQGRDPVPDLLADLLALGPRELAARQEAADLAIKEMGITFTVYAEGGGSKDTWIVAP